MATAVIDTIASLFDHFGALRYGEAMTQSEHALQCAALAQAAACSPAMVAACLLHDIGHFGLESDDAAPTRDHRHEEAGAAYLAAHFASDVSEPVRLHVTAKRYLCAIESGYLDRLSAASQHSLMLQGGPMSASECATFAALPFASDAVQLRRFDDSGKQVGLIVAPFDSYRPLLAGLVVG